MNTHVSSDRELVRPSSPGRVQLCLSLWLPALVCLAASVGCQTQAAAPPLTKAERLAKEKAELLRPFDKPHPFEPADQGYKVVFPGKPKPPQFRDIMHDGSVWSYDERRLGMVDFLVVRTAKQKFYEDQGPRQHLDWKLAHLQNESLLKLRAVPAKTRVTQRFFKYLGLYDAVDVMIEYEISHDDDDYHGERLRRRWIIVTERDVFDVQVDGTKDLVNSHLADEFFASFELRPRAN